MLAYAFVHSVFYVLVSEAGSQSLVRFFCHLADAVIQGEQLLCVLVLGERWGDGCQPTTNSLKLSSTRWLKGEVAVSIRKVV